MQPARRHQYTIEGLIILVVFVAVNVVSVVFQGPISYNDGKGFDRVAYYSVAQQFAKSHNSLLTGPAPYVFRIGTPFLVSLLGKDNLLSSFKIVNIGANAFTVALLIIWLRLYIGNWKIRVLLSILFLTQWHGPVRFVHFYPAYIDPWAFATLLVGLIGIQKIQNRSKLVVIGCLSLIALVGIMFREILIIIPIALLFSTNPIVRKDHSLLSTRITNRPPLIFFIPLLFSLIGIAVTHSIVSQTNSYSFVRTAYTWAYEKPFLTFVHAWLITFGPIIFIAIYNWRKGFLLLRCHQFLFVYLIFFAFLGWIGGSDTERILYLSMPVIYVLVGKALEDNALLMTSPLLIVVGLSQIISQRLFWATPDFQNGASHILPILTPPGNNVPYLDLWSLHGARRIEAISLLQYFVLGAGLLLWFSKREQSVVSRTLKNTEFSEVQKEMVV